jgi:hypothetical protein
VIDAREREEKLIKILHRHKEMLSENERSNLSWKENLFMVGFGYALAAPIYCMWVWRNAKDRPELREITRRRMMIVPALSLFMLWYSGRDFSKYQD